MTSSSSEMELPFGCLYDNDDDGMIDAMICITSEDDAREFRNTLCDVYSDEYNCPVDCDELTKRGDALLEADRLEEAFEAFKVALEANPSNVLIALRLIGLLPQIGRGVEAAAVAIAGVRSSECDEKLEKMAKLQLCSIYALLGYGKKAIDDVNSTSFDLESMKKTKDDKPKKRGADEGGRVSKDELVKGIQKLIVETPQQKVLDDADFKDTLNRLLDPKDNENPAICTFLFHHLREHYEKAKVTKTEAQRETLSKAGVFNNVGLIGALKKAFLSADFRKLSLMECCMLVEYFDLITYGPDKMEKLTVEELLPQDIFQSFLGKLGESIVSNESLQFLVHIGNTIHYDLVNYWLKFLVELAKKQPSFLNTPPFNQLKWHARLVYANVVGLLGSDFEEIMNLKRMFSRRGECCSYVQACSLLNLAVKQDWFPEQVKKLEEYEIVESLNLLDMLLHINFYSKNELLLTPPMEKLVQMNSAGPMRNREGYSPKETISIYETLLLKNPHLLPYCRGRPGLWVHLSQRLEFLAKNMDNFGGHGGLDLECNLNIMNLMLEGDFEDEIDGYVEDDDFVEPVSKAFLRIMSAKVNEPTELLHRLRQLVFRLVVGFNDVSDDISQKLVQPGSKKGGGNIFASFLEMKSFDAVSAQFFYTLLKIAPSAQLKGIEHHPNMHTFLASLLTIIHESKERKREEISNICLCLTQTLLSKTPVLVTRDVLIQSILFSPFEEPEKLVAKLAAFIRPTRRAKRAKKEAIEVGTTPVEPSPIMPICAGLLLAALVRKDAIFRDALFEEDNIYGKVSDEYKKLLRKAVEIGEP